jgi:hypothetical protein
MKVVCNRVIADKGKAFLRELLDNVPAALFVLLPLMALVLKILYPLSKRYYVEHLLFVVHFHAFVFLILILQVLMSRTGSLLRAPELSIDVITFALSLYVPVYLYKSQRRVYEQGRFVTVMIQRPPDHVLPGRDFRGVFHLTSALSEGARTTRICRLRLEWAATRIISTNNP